MTNRMRLMAGGNTLAPALSILRKLGYTVTRESSGERQYRAENETCTFSADDPLVCLVWSRFMRCGALIGNLVMRKFSACYCLRTMRINGLQPPLSRQPVISTLTIAADAITWPMTDDYLLRPENKFVLIHDATSVTAKPRWLLNVPRLSQATPRP